MIKSIKVNIHPGKLIILAAVERWIGRDQIPDKIMRHKGVENEMFNGDPDAQLTRQQVKDYLNISESTYKRKVKDGTLRPVKLPGGDRFYLKDLLAAYLESQRKGRI